MGGSTRGDVLLFLLSAVSPSSSALQLALIGKLPAGEQHQKERASRRQERKGGEGNSVSRGIVLCGFTKLREGPRKRAGGAPPSPRRAALLWPWETLLRLRGRADPVCRNTQRVLPPPLRSVPLGPVLLRSRRSGEAGLLARPTLAGPCRMPRCDSAPGAGLVVPVALRPRISPSGSALSPPILVAETFEALVSQEAPGGRCMFSAATVRPPPPPRVRPDTELRG
ncbi:hypothetical protein NDU88_002013 [Pleurodeles waltl]|uniref:Uncharacterized protein n=1 Tax=Pleurodeles waltl TaxID=8319 RepID=A0AAV7RAS0_PLEWA|nr:hypothetical protein NDU88_002013 [Pleurodeles waltl]